MVVLILGATSPIARAVAEEFARAGHSLCLAARDGEETGRIAADLRVRYRIEATAVDFDACDFDGHQQFIDDVEERAGPIAVALLAFGFMGEQEESERDFSRAKKVIDINYTGAVSLSEALAAKMSQRRRGTIIGITSVAGDRGRASNYIYGSAKGAWTLYLQGLRNRLAKDGVDVMTVKLGFVDTRMTFGMETGIPIASPEQVGAAIYAAHLRGVDTFYYPRFWRGIMTVIKSIPERVFKHLSI